jgi:hypothetical protein
MTLSAIPKQSFVHDEERLDLLQDFCALQLVTDHCQQKVRLRF